MTADNVIFFAFSVPVLICFSAFAFGIYCLIAAAYHGDVERISSHMRFNRLNVLLHAGALSPRGRELRTRGLKALAVAGIIYAAVWLVGGMLFLFGYIKHTVTT